MSSFINPDVDRVSLSERVRKLEGRFGPGGGGGLGVGMPDFDQYPDNAFSETPEGFICKISIDNFGNHNVPELNGIGFKFICFWKWVASWAVFNVIALCRAHLTKQLAGPITQDRNDINTNISIDNQDLLVNTFYPGWPVNTLLQIMSPVVQLSGFKTPTGGGVSTGAVHICSIRPVVNYGQNLKIYIVKSSQTGTIYPCYMFGAGASTSLHATYPSQHVSVPTGSLYGAIPNCSSTSVIQLTDLQAPALNLYPKSWCQ